MAAAKKKAVVKKKKNVTSRNGRLVASEENDEYPELESFEISDDQLTTISFETMTKEDLLREVQKVDFELLRIARQMSEMTKKRNIIFKGDSEALNIKLRTLKQRSDLLFKCLNKIMPDKKSVEGLLTVHHTDVDSIPDDILARIMLGTATDEELEAYKHLLDDGSDETKH